MKHPGRFILNGLLLSLVSLILRAVGVFFNAFITNRVGAEGMGLYQLVLSVYSPALTLATAGVNLATSRLIAEEMEKVGHGCTRALLRRVIVYTLTASTAVALLLYAASDYISIAWLNTDRAAPLLSTLAAGIPFIALSSALNGYFTAVRRVSRTAFVQLFEQLFRIVLLAFLFSSLPLTTGIPCLFAVVFSSVATDALSFLITALLCRLDLKRIARGSKKKRPDQYRRILHITLPVSLSSFLRSGLTALEHLLIPLGLKKSGQSYQTALASYGKLSGMALPILFFPASFLYSFTGLLIPEFAAAKERGNDKEIALFASRVVRTVLIFSVGSAGLLFGFADALAVGIYNDAEVGLYIRLLSFLLPIMYLDTAVDSVLKGLGEQVFTMKVNIVDAVISVVAVWFLVPRFALNGYIAVLYISEGCNLALSFHRLCQKAGIKGRLLLTVFPPLLAVAASLSFIYLLLQCLPIPSLSLPLTAILMALGAVIYLLLLLGMGVVPPRLLLRMVKAVAERLPASVKPQKDIKQAR